MSSDDQMDSRLRDAGTRWRAANPVGSPTVDIDALSPATSTATEAPRRTRWLVVAAAAVLIAGVAVGAVWLGSDRTHPMASLRIGVPTPTSTGGLVGTTWKVFEVTKESSTGSAGLDTAGSSADLKINADGTFTASDGVNTLSGSVTIASTTLTFGDVASTAIGTIDEKVGAVAAAVDSILSGRVTYSINSAGQSTDLTIEHAGVGSLVYRPDDSQAAPPITDPAKLQGRWDLVSYQQTNAGGTSGGGGAATAGGGSSTTSTGFDDYLTVGADGTFTVEHRCYTNTGKVTVGQGTATWSNIHLERALPCPATPDQADEQARTSLVDSVLTGATTWGISGAAQLTITKGGDSLTFAAHATAEPSTSPSTSTSQSSEVPPELVGVTWQLVGYQVLRSMGALTGDHTSASGYDSYLTFGADGSIRAYEPCFGYTQKNVFKAGEFQDISGSGGPKSCASTVSSAAKQMQGDFANMIPPVIGLPGMRWNLSNGVLTLTGQTAVLTYRAKG